MIDRGGREKLPWYSDHPSDLELATGFILTEGLVLWIGNKWPVIEVPGLGKLEVRLGSLGAKTCINIGLAINDRNTMK
jgi:hypothetical protein